MESLIINTELVSLDMSMADHMIKLKNPAHYIGNHYYLYGPRDNICKFDLQEPHAKFIDTVNNNENVIAVMPRRSGKGAILAGLAMWYAQYYSGVTVFIANSSVSAARSMLTQLIGSFSHSDDVFGVSVSRCAADRIELSNGSRIISRAATAHAVRGTRVDLLLGDEFALANTVEVEKFWLNCGPAITKSGRIVLVSTMREHTLFSRIWKRACCGAYSAFRPYQATWDQYRGRDAAWALDMISIVGEETFEAEYGPV